jgi:hypothetical protein
MTTRAMPLQDGESLFDQQRPREQPAVVRPHRHVGHVMDATSTQAYRAAVHEGHDDHRRAQVEAYYRSRGPAGATDAAAALDLSRQHPGTDKNSWSPARNHLWHDRVVLKTDVTVPTQRADGSFSRTRSRRHVHACHATEAEKAWARAQWDAEFGELPRAAMAAARKAWHDVNHAETDSAWHGAARQLIDALNTDGLFDHLLPNSP